jgi:hypothetical protein
MDALAAEQNESSLKLETERLRLRNQIERLNAEARASESTISELKAQVARLEAQAGAARDLRGSLVPAEDLAAAERRIAELELLVTDLETRLAMAPPQTVPAQPAETSQPVPQASRWRPYGTVDEIQANNTVIVRPQIDRIPLKGTEVRVMRSVGGDRVIHLADGIIEEAGAARAVVRLSSASEGAEIYGMPRTSDLIYLFTP